MARETSQNSQTKMTFEKRHMFHLASLIMLFLGVVYCILIYRAGIPAIENSGYLFLVGIPNYYLFYIAILPFVSSGIVYMALHNKNIRFFGELSEQLPPKKKNQLLRYRKILFCVAVGFSIFITLQDSLEKGRALPPYALDFSSMSPNSYQDAVVKYFELKGIIDESGNTISTPVGIASSSSDTEVDFVPGASSAPSTSKYFAYLKFLQDLGYDGESATGFESITSWYSNSSFKYKMENFLSLLAALVISIFVAQLYLFVIAKDYVTSESKNLVIWLIILCSFWIPTKIFSVYYYSLDYVTAPAIVWFSVVLLVVGVLVGLFILIDKNDMSKYASYVAGVSSAAITVVGIYDPSLLVNIFSVIQILGWVYGSILLIIIGILIHLITNHMIQSNEDSL